MNTLKQSLDAVLGPNLRIRQSVPSAKYRRGQHLMAHNVLHTLQTAGGGVKVIEAPTGSGKSMALLVPAALAIREDPKLRILLSTGTKALQNQLSFKDVPALKRMFPTLSVAVLQGRDNYVSPTQLNNIVWANFDNEADRNQARILGEHLSEIWALLDRRDGTVNDLRDWWETSKFPGTLSHRVVGALATPPKENLQMESWHQRALARANQANIVILNHALLCARSTHCEDFWPAPHPGYRGLDQTKLLKNVTPFLFVDEAHELPNTLLEQQSVRSWTTEWKEWAKVGIALTRPNQLENVLRRIDLIEAQWKATNPPPEGQRPSKSHTQLIEQTELLLDTLSNAIAESASYGNPDAAERQPKVNKIKEAFHTLQTEVNEPKNFHNLTLNQNGNPVFECKPFDISEDLAALYAKCAGTILTSATATYGDEHHTRQAYALDLHEQILHNTPEPSPQKQTPVIAVPSPFQLRESTMAYIARGIPPTSEGIPKFAQYCAPIVKALNGRTLILFCSYEAMRQTAPLLEPAARSAGAQILMQAPNLTPYQMACYLRNNPNLVLLGTEGLRTGIDIPGDHLSAVIIHKLPFKTPDRYVKEKSDFVQRNWNLNYFRDFMVPQTTNHLKQAIGRLIRTDTDRGILLIADERIVTASYSEEMSTATNAYNWTSITSPNQLPSPDRIRKHCLAPQHQISQPTQLQPALTR